MINNHHLTTYKRLPICVYDSWRDEKGHLDNHPREYVGVPESELPYRNRLPMDTDPDKPVLGVGEHTHRELEISYMVSGTNIYQVNDKKYQTNPGDMCIKNPFDRHKVFFYNRGYPYFTYVVIFNPADFASMLPSKEAKVLHSVCSGKTRFRTLNQDSARLEPLFERMFESYKSDNAPRLLSGVYELIAELLENCVDDSPGETNPDFEFVKRISDLIDERFGEGLTTASVSDELSYNKSYFCRRFRKSFGMSFSEYLNRCRIQKATQMRLENGLSLSDIAAKCGFDDYAYFARVFSKYCGMPPGSYYRSYGN